MKRDEKPSLIKHGSFVRGHALSFHEQPYLGALFDAVRDTSRPLTLVVGAGVSMSAGLPSWERLILNMAQSIPDSALSVIAQNDPSTPMRKAEIILNLVKSMSPGRSEHEIIRDALYPRDFKVSQGQLACSIARLVAVRKSNARLLTTNFDGMLEAALADYYPRAQISSHSLDDLEKWESLEQDRVGVLHLHGMVKFGRGRKLPIILTESQFLKYGAEVRKIISASLAGSTTIFIGLSMSDPNLVGPLYESASSGARNGGTRFALVVPPAAKGTESSDDSARYAIESARHLERKLKLKSIFLKSYSQLNQVVSDLSLAVLEPARYDHHKSSAGTKSLVYGRRMIRALDRCYDAIGCGRDENVPSGAAAIELNARLYDALHAPAGPVRLLTTISHAYSDYKIGGVGGENHALFLWLRSRENEEGRRPYGLTLVGTSSYIHREEWSLRHDIPIASNTEFAAAQAVFEGIAQTRDIPPAPPLPIWRGIVAVPIVLAQMSTQAVVGDKPADVLTIGAVTLNVTKFVRRETVNGDLENLSIISELDSSDFNRLVESLRRAVQKILKWR